MQNEQLHRTSKNMKKYRGPPVNLNNFELGPKLPSVTPVSFTFITLERPLQFPSLISRFPRLEETFGLISPNSINEKHWILPNSSSASLISTLIFKFATSKTRTVELHCESYVLHIFLFSKKIQIFLHYSKVRFS